MDLSKLLSGLCSDKDDLKIFGIGTEHTEKVDLVIMDPVDGCENLFFQLGKQIKMLRTNIWHSKLFKAYQIQNISPRGLRCKIQPLVGTPDETLLKDWQQAQQEAAMIRVNILASFYERTIQSNIIEVEKTCNNLKRFEHEASFQGCLGKLSKEISILENNLKKKKLHKFARDKEDYDRGKQFDSQRGVRFAHGTKNASFIRKKRPRSILKKTGPSFITSGEDSSTTDTETPNIGDSPNAKRGRRTEVPLGGKNTGQEGNTEVKNLEELFMSIVK